MGSHHWTAQSCEAGWCVRVEAVHREALAAVGQVSLDLSGEPAGLSVGRDLVFIELGDEGQADVPDPGPVDVDREGGGVHPTLDG